MRLLVYLPFNGLEGEVAHRRGLGNCPPVEQRPSPEWGAGAHM